MKILNVLINRAYFRHVALLWGLLTPDNVDPWLKLELSHLVSNRESRRKSLKFQNQSRNDT